MIRRACLIWLMLALPAYPHGNLPGGGGFASGFAHPFAAIEHALAIATLGLLCARTAQRSGVLWLMGGLALGLWWPVATFAAVQAGILGLALGGGLLLAFGLLLPAFLLAVVAWAIGVLIGLETDQPVTTLHPAFAYAGTMTAAALVFLNAMALGTWLGARWNAVPLRIAGSWIAAAAMMILAFLLRGKLGIA